MNKNILTTITVIIIVAAAWFFLDHRSGYPKSVEDLQAPKTSAVATSTTATSTITTTNNTNPISMHTVTIETTKGTIVFETYDNDAPKTVANFISLANKGFYNGLIFHRVIEGFMIQTGDPTGTGMGGPGYKFADELNPSTASYKAGYVKGVVAMANSGPDTNGSQFFIVQADDAGLPNKYTIFGKVVSGLDIVDTIAAVKTNGHPPVGADKPLEDVKMLKVTVAAK
jgi:cyclophilin family peptidyl-prolyl cis-trans isomerase